MQGLAIVRPPTNATRYTMRYSRRLTPRVLRYGARVSCLRIDRTEKQPNQIFQRVGVNDRDRGGSNRRVAPCAAEPLRTLMVDSDRDVRAQLRLDQRVPRVCF